MRKLWAVLLAVCVLFLFGCNSSAQTSALGDVSGVGRENLDDLLGDLSGDDLKHQYSKDIPTICIDPGHGFDDIGTFSALLGDVNEKDITLSIAKLLSEELLTRGFQVLLLHDGDTFPVSSIDDGNQLFNPQERVDYANSQSFIDYYISIHCDSYGSDSSVGGTRIYYSQGTQYTEDSGEAAKSIAEAVNQILTESRETVVKSMEYDKAYYVIRNVAVPSSLIEVGFVTNPVDAANMLDSTWQKNIATGIADGIQRFFAD